MEVGIEDCLHIEFEYDRAKYHLKDCVVGKIYFLLVRRCVCVFVCCVLGVLCVCVCGGVLIVCWGGSAKGQEGASDWGLGAVTGFNLRDCGWSMYGLIGGVWYAPPNPLSSSLTPPPQTQPQPPLTGAHQAQAHGAGDPAP